MPAYDRTQLLKLLDSALNEDEAKTLVFDLSERDSAPTWGNLLGATKVAKLHSLIIFYDELGLVPDLIKAVHAARPDAFPLDATYAFSRSDIEAKLRDAAGLEQRNRLILLLRVWDTWIEGVLRRPVHGGALIALQMENRGEAVAPRPWDVRIQPVGHSSQPLPSHRRIVDVFDEFGGSLLVLGAPGAGKTTTLLELTHDLILRALERPSSPIPAVFNLSSWAQHSLPLADWMVVSLKRQYDADFEVAKSLIFGNKILPLLDGLDEVPIEHRVAARDAINAFRVERGSVQVVVCSRTAEYEMLTAATDARRQDDPTARLALGGAIFIQPLSALQIDTYLSQVGAPLAGLSQAMGVDSDLRELAESPLMLSVMSLAYENTPLDAIVSPLDIWSEATALDSGARRTNRQRHLFDTWVDKMFTRDKEKAADNPGHSTYPDHNTVHWLQWLAQSMLIHGQTSFYLEGLQPDWLPSKADRIRYTLLDRLAWGVVFGLVLGLAVGMISQYVERAAVALGVGLVVGLFGGKLGLVTYAMRSTREVIRDALLGSVIVALGVGLGVGLLVGTVAGLEVVLLYALLGALAGGFVSAPGLKPRSVIVVETLVWSSRMAARRAVAGLIVGLVVGLMIGAVLGVAFGAVFLSDSGLGGMVIGGLVGALIAEPLSGLLVAILFGVIFWLAGGLVGGRIEHRAQPNEGIRRSIRSAGAAALVGTLLVGVVFVLVTAGGLGLIKGVGAKPVTEMLNQLSSPQMSGSSGESANELLIKPGPGLATEVRSTLAIASVEVLRTGLTYGLAFGLVFGLVVGLAFGGYAVLSHYALRFVLWRKGVMPWRYARFLDYADRLIFLRRTGGGYIFIHRSLMEYFASLPENPDAKC